MTTDFRIHLSIFALSIVLWMGFLGAAQATEFVVPEADGYGTQDCLKEQSGCGQAIADAWCASHDRGAAVSYHEDADVTGSIRPASRSGEQNQYVIVCNN